MKFSTHLIVAAGLFFLIFSLVYEEIIFVVIFTLIATCIGLLPDILDFKVFHGNHRNFLSHSPLSPVYLLILIGISLILSSLEIDFAILTSFLLATAFEVHIVLDALNPTGVPLLPNRYINFARIRFDSFLPNLALDMVGIVMFCIPALIS